jgi:extradiol dioxygenase family protein
MHDWQSLADRLTARSDIQWVTKPRIRSKGKPGEQATFFILDPSGRVLEFKPFADSSMLLAK